MMSIRELATIAVAALIPTAYAQSCVTNVLNNTTPAPPTGVQLLSYSYCGGTLNVTAFVQNTDYNKLVNLYYANSQGQSTPLSVVQLGYQGDVLPRGDPNYEYWFASAGDVNLDGITKLLNITYNALDVDKTFVQVLNLPVNASGPAPTTSTIPAPYASPTGFSNDIDTYLAPTGNSEAVTAKKLMFNNIQIPGAANGTVIAAQSYTAPDYAYNWVRDSSLTMQVVEEFYANAKGSLKSKYQQILFNYAKARAQEQHDPGLQTGLGEPKFYLNNSVFRGPWGRPQNDGPATSAIYLIQFAKDYLAAGGSYDTVKKQIYDSSSNPQAPVKLDLLFVASNWSSPSFDLWEEEESDHFYTRMVQHRALINGAVFAGLMNDGSTARTLATQAVALAKTLPQFWDPIRQLVLYEYGPVMHGKYSYKDISIVLGLIHGYANDGIYSYTNDEILSSVVQISTSFLSVFPVTSTHTDGSGQTLGIATGRYPEDVYNGVDTSLGNPWYLSCASMAQFMYQSASAFKQAGSITVSSTSAPFWKYYAAGTKYTVGTRYGAGSAQFKGFIAALQGWGDAYIRTIKFYSSSADGHLSEEFNRVSGVPQGAKDLTWSYASLLTAGIARAQLKGDSTYLSKLANA